MNSHLYKLAALAAGFLFLASACSGSDETDAAVAAPIAEAAAPAPTADDAVRAPTAVAPVPTTPPFDDSSGSTSTTTEAARTGAASAEELVLTFADSWQHGDFAGMNTFAAPAAVAEAERVGMIDRLAISGGDACTAAAGRVGSCELTVDDGSGGYALLYRVILDEEGPNQSLRIAELIPTGDAG